DGRAPIAVDLRELAGGLEAGEAVVPSEHRPIGHRHRRRRVGGAGGVGGDHRALRSEAVKRLAMLARRRDLGLDGGRGLGDGGRAGGVGGGGHDSRVVSPLVGPEPEVEPEVVVPEVVALPELTTFPDAVVVILVLPLPLAPVLLADWLVVVVLATLRAARAGSCPETSTTAISSQMARNSETAPATTRRRIARVRVARACRIAVPRARAWSALLGVMSVPRFQCDELRWDQHRPRPYQSRERPLRSAYEAGTGPWCPDSKFRGSLAE